MAGFSKSARAAAAAAATRTPRLADLLLDGFAADFTGDMRRAADSAAVPSSCPPQTVPPTTTCGGGWLAGLAALHVWDDESWDGCRRVTSSLPARRSR